MGVVKSKLIGNLVHFVFAGIKHLFCFCEFHFAYVFSVLFTVTVHRRSIFAAASREIFETRNIYLLTFREFSLKYLNIQFRYIQPYAPAFETFYKISALCAVTELYNLSLRYISAVSRIRQKSQQHLCHNWTWLYC